MNGDMRMNIRLMGVLHGILVIGMLGYFILRISFYTGGGRSRGRDGNSGVPILAIGAGLTVIGFAGTFFGNLIKAAVSRQREFLADASAVQFTRQAEGIAGALKKIGGFTAGSSIQSPNAPEASHMFFGRATSGFSALFSTHPPIADRIKRLDPSWDGQLPDHVDRVEIGSAAASGFAGASPAAASPRAASPGLSGAVSSIGRPEPSHLRYAAALIKSLPPALVDAARESYGARAVIYALVLNRDHVTRQKQFAHLELAADPGVLDETRRLAPLVGALDARARLPVLEIAIPALRALTADQFRRFEANLVALVESDEVIDLFEWSLHRILRRDLQGTFGRPGAVRVKFRSLSAVASQSVLLLSVVAHAGARGDGSAGTAFGRASAALGLQNAHLQPIESCSLPALDAALGDLDQAAPDVKRRVLEAVVAAITADQAVTATEAELLRVISASMSCPMPPLVDAV
jgi:hypothetical protein